MSLVLGILLEVEPNVDPNIVRPGWTPLLIIVLLLVVLVFLFFSMQKQMRKIRTPDDIEAERRAAGQIADTEARPGSRAESSRAESSGAESGPEPRPEPR